MKHAGKHARLSLVMLIIAATLQIAIAQNATTQPAGPVDFRKLKEALPAKLLDIDRTEATGEKTAVGEFKLSMARGTYVKDANSDDSPRIEITITDYGATKGMIEAFAAWSKMEIDRESDGGYEKTTKVGEHPAFETYQNEGKSGQLQVFVANRFIVQIQTTNVPAEQLKKIGEEMKLEKLAELK